MFAGKVQSLVSRWFIGVHLFDTVKPRGRISHESLPRFHSGKFKAVEGNPHPANNRHPRAQYNLF